SARYSTAVATTPTISSTNDTANENFITDHGSIRLTYSRARRGPRPTAAATLARALRIASPTRAAPVAPPTVIGAFASPGGRTFTVDVPRALARPTEATPVAAPLVGVSPASVSLCAGTGGGGMPGGRVYFGADVAGGPDAGLSPGTVARPTAARPA